MADYRAATMAIPDYQTLMLPVVEAISDGGDHRISEVIEALADRFKLTVDERAELLPSGRTPTYDSRARWAATYVCAAGLAERPRRGWIRLTDEGRKVLGGHPLRIDNHFLDQYPEFREFRQRKSVGPDKSTARPAPGGSDETPEEILERAWRGLRDQVAADLLERLRAGSPRFFEEIVVRLLVNMGYGGSYKDAVAVVGRSGDEGIDGVINEDPLGLDAVYVQAKRWQSVVGRPVVQAFAGSLEGARARKGVLITTSSFSADARAYVRGIEKRIVLIDGARLADLMIEHELGVVRQQDYPVYRVDTDEFEEA